METLESVTVTTLHTVQLNDLPDYLRRHGLRHTRVHRRGDEIVVETEEDRLTPDTNSSILVSD